MFDRAVGLKNDRELGYVEAAALLFADATQRPQPARLAAYRDAMEKLAASQRDDTEATIFYALSLTASEDEADKSYASRKKAATLLEPLFAKHPDHPGLAHEAARLQPHPSAVPYADALTYFARALGSARTGDAAGARAAVAELERLRDREAQLNEPYWTGQIEIQRRGAAAWLAFAEGRQAEALAEMRATAEAEDRTEKAAVTPGPLAPARELVGDMLLAMNRPAEALKEFEATRLKEPNRFRTLYGAIRAAKLAGNAAAACTYSAELLKICERADTPLRPELVEIR